MKNIFSILLTRLLLISLALPGISFAAPHLIPNYTYTFNKNGKNITCYFYKGYIKTCCKQR